ncbi:MAG: hypothetical protein II990_05775 [Muribaculaceae bacterium]|nr:hypothetical protein [Muribaculaceae bacterium]
MKLSLDVFIFQLQKKLNNKYQLEPVDFNEAYSKFDNLSENHKGLNSFLSELIFQADTTFKLNSDNSKAFSFDSANNIKINSERNTISGKFIGGNTGIKVDVYSNTDSSKITHTIEPTEVSSLKFFFKFWMPKDFNTGILIVQRYSQHTCLALFKDHLSATFKKLGYRFVVHKFVPKDIRDKFKQNCSIYEIKIANKQDLDSDLKPKLDLLSTSKFSRTISNISLSLSQLITDKVYQNKVSEEIKELEPNYDPSLHNLKYFYIDNSGQKASSSSEEIECLLPSVNLGVTCSNSDGSLNWEEIEKVADNYIALIKNDLNYSVKEQ